MNTICAINHIDSTGLVRLGQTEETQLHDGPSLRIILNSVLCVHYNLTPNPCPTGGLKGKGVYLVNDPYSNIGLRKDMRKARTATELEKKVLATYLQLLRNIFPNEGNAIKLTHWTANNAHTEAHAKARSEQIKTAVTKVLTAEAYTKALAEFIPHYVDQQHLRFLLPEKERGNLDTFMRVNAQLVTGQS